MVRAGGGPDQNAMRSAYQVMFRNPVAVNDPALGAESVQIWNARSVFQGPTRTYWNGAGSKGIIVTNAVTGSTIDLSALDGVGAFTPVSIPDIDPGISVQAFWTNPEAPLPSIQWTIQTVTGSEIGIPAEWFSYLTPGVISEFSGHLAAEA
jgi:hypothetical protein